MNSSWTRAPSPARRLLRPELLVLVGPALFGVVIAIPGTIVFNKCKRR